MANIVGNAFVEQYYTILHKAPEELHKFYDDYSSLVSRPQPPPPASAAKEMTPSTAMTATTLEGINNLVFSSLQLQNIDNVKIWTIDSQFSCNGGIIILVTGSLSSTIAQVPRKFTQTFFLAPQDDKADKVVYFVMNDIFRYVDEDDINEQVNNAVDQLTLAAVDETTPTPTAPTPTPTSEEKKQANFNNIVPENGNLGPQVTGEEAAAALSNTAETKKSFASVVNAYLKENKAPIFVRKTPPKPVAKPPTSQPAPNNGVADVEQENNVVAGGAINNNNNKSPSCGIYVAHLPMDASVQGLEKIFKAYGAIKRYGIQIKRNQQHGTCFAFVEFESSNSMDNVLKASSAIKYGDSKLLVEKRRPNNDRARFRGGQNHSGGRGDGAIGNVEAYEQQRARSNGGKAPRQPTAKAA